MTAMGVKIDEFDILVCNSFQAKILNDQLCYEVDLNKFSDNDNINSELELGFNFIMDYNEDRQMGIDKTPGQREENGLASNIIESVEDVQAVIYLNTIGMK